MNLSNVFDPEIRSRQAVGEPQTARAHLRLAVGFASLLVTGFVAGSGVGWLGSARWLGEIAAGLAQLLQLAGAWVCCVVILVRLARDGVTSAAWSLAFLVGAAMGFYWWSYYWYGTGSLELLNLRGGLAVTAAPALALILSAARVRACRGRWWWPGVAGGLPVAILLAETGWLLQTRPAPSAVVLVGMLGMIVALLAGLLPVAETAPLRTRMVACLAGVVFVGLAWQAVAWFPMARQAGSQLLLDFFVG